MKPPHSRLAVGRHHREDARELKDYFPLPR